MKTQVKHFKTKQAALDYKRNNAGRAIKTTQGWLVIFPQRSLYLLG